MKKPSNSILLLILISVLFFGCGETGIVGIYVSPDGDTDNPGTIDKPISLEGVKDKLSSEIKQKELKELNVIFRKGTYQFSSTLILDDYQSFDGTVKVVFKAYKDEEVVFSGAQEITGWEATGKGIWEKDLEDDEYFEQLYVNDRMATRARTPNKSDEVSQWFLIRADYDLNDAKEIERLDILLKDADLSDYGSVNYGEIVIMKDWATFRKQINIVIPDKALINVKLPVLTTALNRTGNSLFAYERQSGYNAYLEGHPGFLDAEGEWAIDTDRKKILYKPVDGENIENTSIFRPVIPRLLIIRGTKDHKIQNVHFENIRFSHTGYWLPKSGHDGSQAAMFYTDNKNKSWSMDDDALLPEAVRLENVENCSFKQCRFSLIGGSGLYLGKGCQLISVSDNTFRDIGGNCLLSGLKIDPVDDSLVMVSNNTINDNLISNGGRIYPSGVGIWLGFCHSHNILNNTVCDMPYTGISVGWQWNPLPTSSGSNRIENNHIHHVMKSLGDGGGIYTLGKQPGSILKGNHIHDIERSKYNHASPNNGIFIDEGSRDYRVEGNLIYKAIGAPIRGHRAAGVTIENNVFVTDEGQAGVSHSPPYGNRIFVFKNEDISWTRPESFRADHYPDEIEAMHLSGNSFLDAGETKIENLIDSLNMK